MMYQLIMKIFRMTGYLGIRPMHFTKYISNYRKK